MNWNIQVSTKYEKFFEAFEGDALGHALAKAREKYYYATSLIWEGDMRLTELATQLDFCPKKKKTYYDYSGCEYCGNTSKRIDERGCCVSCGAPIRIKVYA